VSTRSATLHQRPSPLLFGVVLFLASELMFFGGLFAAYYFLRAQSSPWPPRDVELDTLLVGIATALLVTSSITMQAGTVRLRRGDRHETVRWLVATLVLGAAFLAIQLFDYSRAGFEIGSHAYGTLFYAMTGFHGLHVLAGLLLMLVVLARLPATNSTEVDLTTTEAATYYWHFVDAVWLGLFATIYLIR
jgi:cytochrome c oxidase subunit III